MELNAIEQRVLGALIEKEMATPDYYPLSLNALVNACNQKNNREPVLSLTESDVLGAIEVMRHSGLAYEISGPQHRVAKYSHGLGAKLNLGNRELAILSVLLCRGPQTPGELRGRTQSLYAFEDLESVLLTLERMAKREELPLVKELPRAPGARESRWAHLLGPLPEMHEEVVAMPRADRMADLERRVAELESFVERLKGQLGLS
ncbi:MAG: YceH family protein [Bryobacter sp.]|nr:YceH family protein [Bryobacter sp.]